MIGQHTSFIHAASTATVLAAFLFLLPACSEDAPQPQAAESTPAPAVTQPEPAESSPSEQAPPQTATAAPAAQSQPAGNGLRQATSDEADRVRAVFRAFSLAVSNNSVDAIEGSLSRVSIQLLEQIRLAAMHMEVRDLLQREFRHQYLVLLLRSLAAPELVVNSVTEELLLRLFVNKDCLPVGAIAQTEIGEIRVAETPNGTLAEGRAVQNGQPMDYGYRFVLEDGAWKIDYDRVLFIALFPLEQSLPDDLESRTIELTVQMRSFSEARLATVSNPWTRLVDENGRIANNSAIDTPDEFFRENTAGESPSGATVAPSGTVTDDTVGPSPDQPDGP